MSRVFDALRRMEKEQGRPVASPLSHPMELLGNTAIVPTELDGVASVQMKVGPSSLLVALSEPRSLGAEKFRVLATRLENLRRKKEIKSLQITSGGANEGKSLVAANLAVTFAKRSGSKVLLLEGDFYRPSLAALSGLNDLPGLSHWWSEQTTDIEHFLRRLDDMPLWFLSAGNASEQPSHILESTKFAEAFNRLARWFDWIIVDSTPMFPIADANLWSRLVDGTLLVVREGVTSVKAIKKGLESLDDLKLVGTVMNEVAESERSGYAYQYYGGSRNSNRKAKK